MSTEYRDHSTEHQVADLRSLETLPLAPLIAEAQETFQKELPELLSHFHGQWVAYRGSYRAGVSNSKSDLYTTCFARGWTREEFVVRKIVAVSEHRDAGVLREV